MLSDFLDTILPIQSVLVLYNNLDMNGVIDVVI